MQLTVVHRHTNIIFQAKNMWISELMFVVQHSSEMPTIMNKANILCSGPHTNIYYTIVKIIPSCRGCRITSSFLSTHSLSGHLLLIWQTLRQAPCVILWPRCLRVWLKTTWFRAYLITHLENTLMEGGLSGILIYSL